MASFLSVVVVLLVCLFINFCSKLYKQRRMMKGLPMPPHHPLLGHLRVLAKIAASLPFDIHPHSYAHYIRKAYDLGPIFYLDTWPMADPMLVIAGDPQAANEVTVAHSLPKHSSLASFLTPFGGKQNLVSMEGKEWKAWRAIFNPGFAPGNLMGLVPDIVDAVEVFARVLGEWADRKEVVIMEEVATRVTVDVIGRVVLGTNLNSQTSENELVSAFRSQARWAWATDPFALVKNLHPIRPFIHWRNARRMDKYLEREFEERFASKGGDRVKKQKHVIDLALETYINEEKPPEKQGFDETFKRFAINQVKIFIFAGHDTTSSTICWIYHMLHQHPSALSTLRREHDDVFGKDITLAPALLRSNPHLLNRLPYTLAVIKEVLRLFPPASSVRGGEAGYSFQTPTVPHTTYPTESFMVWPSSHALHHNPDLFPDPFSFDPTRFLPPNSDNIPKGAFRPFEYGPRNCIGQDLALLEVRIVLVLTVRAFDIWSVYEEMDELEKNKGKGWLWGKGEEKSEIENVDGERAYQILVATAKPKKGLPARVKRTGRGEGL